RGLPRPRRYTPRQIPAEAVSCARWDLRHAREAFSRAAAWLFDPECRPSDRRSRKPDLRFRFPTSSRPSEEALNRRRRCWDPLPAPKRRVPAARALSWWPRATESLPPTRLPNWLGLHAGPERLPRRRCLP